MHSLIATTDPTGATATAGTNDIFDPAEALHRACDDLELLSELAELFVEHRDQLLTELTEAVAQGNAQRIAEAGHALKGSVGTFTTKRPFDLARQLESTGKEADLLSSARLLAELKDSLMVLESEVHQFLAAQN